MHIHTYFIIFHIRSGTVDLKCNRKYKYGDDTCCRLCGINDESVHHVVNECPLIHRENVMDPYSDNCDELLEVSNRCLKFDEKVEEIEKLKLEMAN